MARLTLGQEIFKYKLLSFNKKIYQNIQHNSICFEKQVIIVMHSKMLFHVKCIRVAYDADVFST